MVESRSGSTSQAPLPRGLELPRQVERVRAGGRQRRPHHQLLFSGSGIHRRAAAEPSAPPSPRPATAVSSPAVGSPSSIWAIRATLPPDGAALVETITEGHPFLAAAGPLVRARPRAAPAVRTIPAGTSSAPAGCAGGRRPECRPSTPATSATPRPRRARSPAGARPAPRSAVRRRSARTRSRSRRRGSRGRRGPAAARRRRAAQSVSSPSRPSWSPCWKQVAARRPPCAESAPDRPSLHQLPVALVVADQVVGVVVGVEPVLEPDRAVGFAHCAAVGDRRAGERSSLWEPARQPVRRGAPFASVPG